jgi:iron complex outermembrane receptor protein
LWGTNAVNGVINVITRSARDTRGTLVSGGAGNTEAGIALRHGAALGSGGNVRVYGKFFDRQNTELANGTEVPDDWRKGQLGFRSDWGEGGETVTVQGDAYSGDIEQAAPGTTEITGVNLLGRWNRTLGNGSALRLQGYYDRTTRDIPGTFSEDLDILDFEAQHSLRPAGAHELVWGGGYRYARDRVQNSPGIAFLPLDKTLHWESAFVQDSVPLRENVRATLGLRLERNVYTGLEFLPSARLAWKPAPERLVWGAVSRAVRAPSRLDRELFVPGSPPFVVLAGGPDFQSEVSTVTELGYRAQPSSRLSYSVTAYHHIYDDLRSVEPSAGGPVLGNKMKGTGTGVEAWGAMQVTGNWRLSAGGFVLHQDLELESDSGDTNGVRAAGNDPDYRVVLRSTLDLPRGVELDAGVRHVAKLPDPAVPAYTAVDLRLGWRPRADVEVSLTGQNLFDPRHPEFGTAATRSELARSVYGKILWRF